MRPTPSKRTLASAVALTATGVREFSTRLTTPLKRGLAETLSLSVQRQPKDAEHLGVSLGAVREALTAVVQEDFDRAALEGDRLVAQVGLPLLGEVYSDAEPVARAAQERGHRTTPTMTLGTGRSRSGIC